MKRFYSALACLLVVATLLCSCQFIEQEKEFSVGEMSITLSDYFYEVNGGDNYTAIYESNQIVVFALAQMISGFDEEALPADATLEDYGALVLKTNNREDLELQTKDGVTYFVYERTSDSSQITYTHLTAIYKGPSAYWMIQFVCESADYPELEEKMFQYAASVTLTAEEEAE